LRRATNSKNDSPQKIKTEIYSKVLAASMGNTEMANKAANQAMIDLGVAENAPAAAPAVASPAAAPGSRAASGKVTVGAARYPEGTRLQGKPGKDGTPGKPFIVRNGEAVPM